MKFASCLLLVALVSSPSMAQDPAEEGDKASATVVDEMGNETTILVDPELDTLSELAPEGEEASSPVAQTWTCASGYIRIGSSRLCLSQLYGTARYRYAEYHCRINSHGGRVADQGDYYTVDMHLGSAYFNSYAILGIWLGPRTGDNAALYINYARWYDMDGEASVFDFRYYRCAYDL